MINVYTHADAYDNHWILFIYWTGYKHWTYNGININNPAWRTSDKGWQK